MEEMQECPRSSDCEFDSAAAFKFNLLIKFSPFISAFVFERGEGDFFLLGTESCSNGAALFFLPKSYILSLRCNLSCFPHVMIDML